MGFLETNLTWHPFLRRITCSVLSIKRFQLSKPSVYPCKQIDNTGSTYCKVQDSVNPVTPAAIHSRIHHEYNMQVGCYLFHFDLKITIDSYELPTSFRYHLSLLFNNTISSLLKHICIMWVDQNKLINVHVIQCGTGRHTASTQTWVSPPWHCICCYRKYDRGCTFTHCL